MNKLIGLPIIILGLLLVACESDAPVCDPVDPLAFCGAPVDRPPPPANTGIHGFANGCYAMDASEPGSSDTRWLVATPSGEELRFSARDAESGARFFMKPSDLGTYLFYDAERGYLTAEDGALSRETELLSDILVVDDGFQSGAEWEVQVSVHDPERFQLRHLSSRNYLTTRGLAQSEADAAVVAFYPQTGCAEFPELTVDAEGAVELRQFDDGSVFGIVDTHSHLLSNFGFGGGGMFHGAPFHRLGVEHALPDCETFHGRDGRKDFFAYGFDEQRDVDFDTLLFGFLTRRLPEFNHFTPGYPDFTDWPATNSSTHQTQYYTWLKRAYLGGLRLVVQHATSNQVICDVIVGRGIQPVRYSCNDMVAIDRQIEEAYNMERYIDAQEGGPGQGWFRIVTSPEQAREVISAGKMAVILGIEVSNLFECLVWPLAGTSACDEEEVMAQLDRYHARGVRAMFPVHKYDNAFSAGDGSRGIIEFGNFINSGHYSNFTQDCDLSIPGAFDGGGVSLGGMNMPREEYTSVPPHDLSGVSDDPIGALLPFIDELTSAPLEGEWCQNAGMTPLGEILVLELMRRGMILEIDHFPRRGYGRVYEMLVENDYPAAGTHGGNHGGRIYALGGVSKTGLGRCRDPERAGSMADSLLSRVELIAENGGYPAEGFGFDFNGFAGAPGPRFGERSRCNTLQEEPLTYPFQSYDGTITFTEPRVGNRTIDFNTEGMAHIGLMPELIEDARRDGVTDEELEPLFRSAEGYIRMWERSESRAAELRGD